MLASLGFAEASVIRRPRVAILATGEEVIPIDRPLAPGKIHNANSYSNAAQVLRYGGVPLLLGIARDRREELSAKIQGGLEQGVDLFLTSGGVSVGDFDIVKEVLAAEGEIHFWWVNMKPGKPLAFGQIGGVPMLGLPGNPVAVMVTFLQFVTPALHYLASGRPYQPLIVQATARCKLRKLPGRYEFQRGILSYDEQGTPIVDITGHQGSGILTSMSRANCFILLNEEQGPVNAGDQVQVQPFTHTSLRGL